MTSMEIHFRYAAPPTEAIASALAGIREVYGIHRLKIDRAGRALCIEYDASRLNAAAVTRLVSQAGLKIAPETWKPIRRPISTAQKSANCIH
jgi:hypothetical protein